MFACFWVISWNDIALKYGEAERYGSTRGCRGPAVGPPRSPGVSGTSRTGPGESGLSQPEPRIPGVTKPLSVLESLGYAQPSTRGALLTGVRVPLGVRGRRPPLGQGASSRALQVNTEDLKKRPSLLNTPSSVSLVWKSLTSVATARPKPSLPPAHAVTESESVSAVLPWTHVARCHVSAPTNRSNGIPGRARMSVLAPRRRFCDPCDRAVRPRAHVAPSTGVATFLSPLPGAPGALLASVWCRTQRAAP